MNQIQAVSIGKTAKHTLRVADKIKIRGASSRGLYLDTSTRWILFVSFEHFRGPLTINAPGNAEIFENAKANEKVYAKESRLIFPQREAVLFLGSAQTWEAQSAKRNAKPNTRGQITALLRTVREPLLEKLLGSAQHENSAGSRLEQDILKVYKGLRENDFSAAAEHAKQLLGTGIGLTPEGDDFLVGLMLALETEKTRKDTQQRNAWFADLVRKAYEKTTTVSANLMECAAMGEGDERLIAAMQALKYGDGDGQAEIKNLLGWGNTSGRMALAGITAGLLAG